MRRMIIQNDYVNDKEVKAEKVAETVVINDYDIHRIGNLVFCNVSFSFTAATAIPADSAWFRIRGVPESYMDEIHCIAVGRKHNSNLYAYNANGIYSFASADAYTPQIGELMTCQIIYEVK